MGGHAGGVFFTERERERENILVSSCGFSSLLPKPRFSKRWRKDILRGGEVVFCVCEKRRGVVVLYIY